MIITSDLATQLDQVNNHAMSLRMISNNNNNSNFILLSFMMSMYLLTVVYYLILLTEWFINKLQAKRSHSLYNINIVDDNSPQQDTNTNNNNNSVNTQQIITNSSESSQEQLINNSECTIPSESSSENHHHEEQQENTINNQTEADAYIHPDLSPSSVSSTSDSIFTTTNKPAAGETVQAESLLTIFKELVQRVIAIEKEWTRIISSQLENSSRLVYYDSSDSSLCSSATTSSSSSDEYCHVSGRSSFQNVRMRRTTQSSNTMKRMNSFQFPRGINFAL